MGRKKQNEPYKLREYKNKQGQTISYYLDFYENGQREKTKIEGIKPKINPRTAAEKAYNETCRIQAQKRAAEANADYLADRHGHVRGANKKEAKGLFSEYIKKVASEREISKSTRKLYEWTAGRVTKADNKPLCEITPLWIEAFLKSLKEEGLKASSRRSCYNKIKTALTTATRRKLIPRNPCEELEGKDIPKPKKAHTIEYLTKEDIQKLKDTPIKSKATREAFLFACRCGLRYSDIMRLRWENFEEVDGVLYIKLVQKKTSEPYFMPLSESARKSLPPRREINPFVFDKVSPDVANYNLKKWAEAAGIKINLHFHISRHTFAVHFLSYAKGQIYELQKFLGHKDISNTQIYADIVNTRKEEVINNMPDI